VEFSGRFRQFPVTVHIDLGTAAPDLQGTYLIALEEGFRRWQIEAGSEIAGVEFVGSPENAQIVSEFVEVIPGEPLALAASRPTDFETGRIIAKSAIEFSTVNLGRGAEQRFRDGRFTRDEFIEAIVALVAHEYGHSLGIRTHPTDNADFLMGSRGFEVHSRPTLQDLNTLRDNYCRE